MLWLLWSHCFWWSFEAAGSVLSVMSQPKQHRPCHPVESLRGPSDKIGTIRRRLACPAQGWHAQIEKCFFSELCCFSHMSLYGDVMSCLVPLLWFSCHLMMHKTTSVQQCRPGLYAALPFVFFWSVVVVLFVFGLFGGCFVVFVLFFLVLYLFGIEATP